jgi:hypothetical protein
MFQPVAVVEDARFGGGSGLGSVPERAPLETECRPADSTAPLSSEPPPDRKRPLDDVEDDSGSRTRRATVQFTPNTIARAILREEQPRGPILSRAAAAAAAQQAAAAATSAGADSSSGRATTEAGGPGRKSWAVRSSPRLRRASAARSSPRLGRAKQRHHEEDRHSSAPKRLRQ